MAFKLTAAQRKQHGDMIYKIGEEYTKLNDAVTAYNEGLAELREKLEDAISSYNESLEEAREFVNEVSSEAQDEYDGKSERWQESERGEMASSFIERWTDAENELDAVELDLPEEIELDVVDHTEILGNLPSDLED